jgi:hypothetical protein
MMDGALDHVCRTHRCLICINPAPVPTVSLVSALRIGLERPASTGGWLRDHPELLTQGDQNQTLDHVIGIADCRLHGRNHGTRQRHHILPICRLPYGLHRKSRCRAAPAAGCARGGDPRRRCCRHAHEPWRPGRSRRSALIKRFQHERHRRLPDSRFERRSARRAERPVPALTAGTEYHLRSRLPVDGADYPATSPRGCFS